ncbi:MAG: hypothetical protein M3072_10280 [Candidatus Dormibacteraeota bacterium]|nr:hypothetical protein [Candidatus Dormibacteraeota bacterium]
MDFNRPNFVGSGTSGVDGASEGGRVSTFRQPTALALYAVPLVKQIKDSGYQGKLIAAPALIDGRWALRLTYDGDAPRGVPELWHGHHVAIQPQAPEPPAERRPGD